MADVCSIRHRPFSAAVHFKHFAPEKVPYALNRYMYEAERHYSILDKRLDQLQYMVGETYTIVDMAVWGWVKTVSLIQAKMLGRITQSQAAL